MARTLTLSTTPRAVAVTGAEDSVASTAILEFQSPTLTLVTTPVAFSTRMTMWLMATMVVSMFLVLYFIPVDRTVSTSGVILAKEPNGIVQPLETAIMRRIYVHEGQTVKKGELLAELDPTFAGSDDRATEAQRASLQAQVDRMRAELADKPYLSDGSQYGQLEEMAYLQRRQQFVSTLDDYNAKVESLEAKVQSAQADISSLSRQNSKLQALEDIRHDLEKYQVGSKLNTLQAELDRESGQQKLDEAKHGLDGARRDLASMIAERDSWRHQWYSDTQTQESQQERLLSDMTGQNTKNVLRRQLVEIRAETDSIVLNVARVAPGTVLQSGVELMTTVPVDAPLEVAAAIDGADAGFVKVGDQARIKFDTLPYFRYGYAIGHVERVSADSFVDPSQGTQNPQATQPNFSANAPQSLGTAPVYYYRVSITLDKMELRHPPESFSIKPGLPLQVDINVGKRTILQYLLDRVMPFLASGAREPT
jgi:HlyD family secretion protein